MSQNCRVKLGCFFLVQGPLVKVFMFFTFLQEIDCLRLIYHDKKKSSFEPLLERDSSVSIHRRNIRLLAIEMYKIKHVLYPVIFSETFLSGNKNLRRNLGVSIPRIKRVKVLSVTWMENRL